MKAYLSLVKFSHTLFAMPFALLSFFLALQVDNSGWQGWKFLLVVLCMVFARSAAMGFNRYIDRHIDSVNQRTSVREIPSGVIKPQNALLFVVLMSLLFVATTYFINPLCFYLSPVALLVILGYSYTKRFTWLCHFVLGLGLGLAPVGAYLAVTGRFDTLPILYGFMVMLWVSGFDILYALQDENFDREQNLHSVPERFGKEVAKRISLTLHTVCACLLIYICFRQHSQFESLNFLHWLGSAGFICLLIRQHWLVAKYDLQKINQAFFESNGMASLLFGLAIILDLAFVSW